MGVTVLAFAVELRKARTKYIFSDFCERTGASFKMECRWKTRERGKKVLNNPFSQNLYGDITFRTQCDKERVEMEIKVSKHKLNVLREEVELINTRTA